MIKIKKMNKNFNAFKLAWETAYMVTKNRDILDPQETRQNAKKNTREFYESLEKKYWIKVKYNFWEKTKKDCLETIKVVEKYVFEWT